MALRRKLRALRHVLVATALTGAFLPAVSTGVASAATLPQGFVVRDTATGFGQYELTDFGYLPDKSILAISKSGLVNWVPETGGAPRTIATLPTHPIDDMGLVGLAIAPDYATSHTIYLTRSIDTTAPNWVMRLSKFTVTVDGAGTPTGLTGEQNLFQVPGIHNVHGINSVIAAADGTLWLSIGDAADFTKMDPDSMRAQDINSPYGKILHLAANGNGVPANPYYEAADPGSARSKVFARGFRNPFRFSIDPNLGLPVVGDVGWNTWEELDVVQRGGNYGWPCWEGNVATPDHSAQGYCAGVPNTAPIVAYHHGAGDGLGNSITSGIVYNGTSYPDSYRGAFFFGDYVAQQIWTVKYNDQGQLSRGREAPAVFKAMGGPSKFGAAPNGDIVYADILSGNLRRLSYTSGNTAPVAAATSTTDPATRTVSFDGSTSVDYDNDPLTYAWDFGDGTTGTGVKPTHTYAAGTESFTAKLTVTDPLGASDSKTIAVAPGNHSPVLTLTTPGADATFAVGDTINVSATATDTEDGDLAVTWTSAILHCSTETTCHRHPGDGVTGPTFSPAFTDHPDARLELTATVTDSAGVVATQTYTANPRLHRLTLVSTQPAALSIPIEGGVSTALVTEKANVQVEAPALAVDGVSKFTGWQGGPTTTGWSVTIGTSDLTVTANYDTPIDQRYNADAAAQAKLGAPTAAEVTDGTVHYRAYANGRLYWTAATGAKYVVGPVLTKYLALGGHAVLGAPTVDTGTTPDGVGQFNHFTNWSSVYYTSDTGAHLVKGRIRDKWQELGWERSPLGYPTTDETATPDGRGFYSHFVKAGSPGSIYFTPQTDAHAIYGGIRVKWVALDWERGLGYPTTDELGTPDGVGRYNHFDKGGSIYYSVASGTHMIQGEIKKRWAALGWERSYLRYPTSDEYAYGAGFRSDFQGGYITWTAAQGPIDRPW